MANIHALDFTWQLQVTDPSFELSYTRLDEKSFRPFLKKTSWRCQVGPLINKSNLEVRELYCDYSVKKAGTIKTTVSCGPQKHYNEVSLELYDEKKELTFNVMLLCRKKKKSL